MLSTGLCKRSALSVLLALCCIPLSSIQAEQQNPYQKWLNEDVRWIISSQERAEFLKLSTDKQRDEFVVAFWSHHNPAGAPENSFKAEHYRRLAFANQHFAASLPGWETDRGHIYIVYGPPDSIERANNEVDDSGYPYQIWHYSHVQGKEMTVRFVDTCRCGNFVREAAPNKKN